MQHREIIIIGGGLGGLIAAYLLAKHGRQVLLIEKKTYPFHRVCGEYISNEVKDFLIREGLFPTDLDPADIHTFQLSAIDGKIANLPLEMGGFGISRYALDLFLYQKAKSIGAEFLLQTQAEQVNFKAEQEKFEIHLLHGEVFTADYVIGAFGKRSKIDKSMGRSFMEQRSPYIGVKYHIRTEMDPHTVALHNFEGGYCGVNKVEGETYNLCYLGSRHSLKKYGSVPAMEAAVLHQNPHLKRIFKDSEFLFDKAEVINEINFEPKLPVENRVLMVGDAAGLITPLCGNGMAIAMHTGKLAAEQILSGKSRREIEKAYMTEWNALFKQRLWVGRTVQKLFGAKWASSFSVGLINSSSMIGRQIVRQTHGIPF
ncbi:NAD(P)/FAD-dependent oxidoreductase [Mongoliitalea daihaiensis]|nr:NAD(P)/FAD-dependent oxidoreductase [Mongoliitalea daihaiensis]